MQLKIKKSQKSSMMGKASFQIDVRADMTPEEQALIKKYSLSSLELYSSEDRKRNLANALTADTGSVRGATSMLSSMVKSAFSLKVTVNDLAAGKSITANDLNEVIEAQETIVQAAKNLQAYLELSKTFDGREEVIDLKG